MEEDPDDERSAKAYAASVYCRKGVTSKIGLWQQKADEHLEKQMINPFSGLEGASHRAKLSKYDANYGLPVAGSLTERRGKQAGAQISCEIVELCQIIATIGQRVEESMWMVMFAPLFEHYTRVSNKLVGILMRAKKQKYVHFEGEMLYQGRDDDVVITLYKDPQTFDPSLIYNPDDELVKKYGKHRLC
ncbi:actin-binding Rho-activating protein-like [Lineus longissimus]|uniref:actin-binding Rho-activating protein-like n=1 Tax=Lineus longissimus TaxID=88925 RepID=UPI00315C7450